MATDLQSLTLVASCFSYGKTIIKENIFENRFLIVPELKKMGAKIKLKNSKVAIVEGIKQVNPCKIQALDLRGGASLIVAGLATKGKTIVQNAHFVDRGYEDVVKLFASLGAKIKRV